MAVPPPLIIELEQLQNNLIAQATGGGADALEYVKLRAKLLREPVVKNLLPDFVHKYRDLGQFWGWIKYHLRTYRERRELIWQAFRPAFEAVEKGLTGPVHAVASETLAKLDAQHVADTWRKVMTRIGDDPEGAITAMRSCRADGSRLGRCAAGDVAPRAQYLRPESSHRGRSTSGLRAPLPLTHVAMVRHMCQRGWTGAARTLVDDAVPFTRRSRGFLCAKTKISRERRCHRVRVRLT
jgi:hypothetical protein